MLVLTLVFGETVVIGDDIRITLVPGRVKNARIGIDLPADVIVRREKNRPAGGDAAVEP